MSAAAHPGVNCLRTTLVELDNATLWRTYILHPAHRAGVGVPITQRPASACARCFTELFDAKGHLFISRLAYRSLRAHAARATQGTWLNGSCFTLYQTLATQRRVAASMQRRDGRAVHAVHARKATRPWA